jgi:hypothetical protein
MPRTLSSLCFALTCCMLLAGSVAAQQFTRTEIGLDTSILHGTRLFSLTDAGIGGRFTYNLTPSIAIDSEFDFYFTNLDERLTQDGGRASVGVIGIKAGIRKRKYGVFFKARPGVMSFGDVFTSAATFGNFATTRKSHAVLDFGVATEFYPSARTILRFDVGQLLVRYGDSTAAVLANGVNIRNRGRIDGPLHIVVGTSYRLGTLREEHESSPAPQRFSAGGQYSLLTSNRAFQEFVRDESGLGGWFTWNFSKYFALDSSATFFPRQIHNSDFQQGGRTFQALAGVRGGVRRGRFGVFGKFRPGIQLYTATEGDSTTFIPSPFTDIAFDTGGIIEVYTSRRTLLRFDAGDTTIYYRPRHIIGNSGRVPGFTNNTIQLTTGFGFRF